MNIMSEFGIIGLAVMGENLALNVERNGFSVSVYNRTVEKVTSFINGRGKGKNFYGAMSIKDFCASLEHPRKIMLMVKAGEAVDKTIELLLPYISKGDIIIDGGNSNYTDTERRVIELGNKEILYVGSGVSGGELGALYGPSIMPGGAIGAWPIIKPIFEAITAKVGTNNEPCTTWIGNGGAGHFVKMVHNGIEYGDMQIICEGYHIASKLLKMDNATIANIFDEWNNGPLQSYLIEITANILKYKENENFLIDKILDTAGQKGTGKWTAITALDEGIPLNLITESVYARCISAQKEIRVKLNKEYSSTFKECSYNNEISQLLKIGSNDLEAAIYASKLISYAQGFELITSKSNLKNWGISPSNVAKIWRGGCIIRSKFLDDIAAAYNGEELPNLLISQFYREVLPSAIQSLRRIVAAASLNAIPIAGMSAALSYYDAITSNNLPANLLQAQRDYFGAHTYERTDKPRGEFFHTNWTGEGGDTVSTSYNR
ncbi:MAG: decarboxylating NADP(+)-dependent phosphogluconate dehydrogenase [Bacteroidales bacterium]